MGRRMEQDQGAYRAVITTTYGPGWTWYTDGEVVTVIRGPYATEAQAKARVTREKNLAAEDNEWGEGRTRTVVGWTEQATAWEKVTA